MPGQASPARFDVPGFVNNFELQANQFGVEFHLPGRLQPLISDVDEAALICVYDELTMLQIRTPVVDGNEDCQIFLFVG